MRQLLSTERVTSGQEMAPPPLLAFCSSTVSKKAMAASPAVTALISFCQDPTMQRVASVTNRAVSSAYRVTSGELMLQSSSLDASKL